VRRERETQTATVPNEGSAIPGDYNPGAKATKSGPFVAAVTGDTEKTPFRAVI
jgi:hypothetical protein